MENTFEFLILGNKASSVFFLFFPPLFFTAVFLICSVERFDFWPRHKISLEKIKIQETTAVTLLCII